MINEIIFDRGMRLLSDFGPTRMDFGPTLTSLGVAPGGGMPPTRLGALRHAAVNQKHQNSPGTERASRLPKGPALTPLRNGGAVC